MSIGIYRGAYPFRYFLCGVFGDFEVSEKNFFDVVGYDRRFIPMRYAVDDVNRQNFFLGDIIIAYRVR